MCETQDPFLRSLRGCGLPYGLYWGLARRNRRICAGQLLRQR